MSDLPPGPELDRLIAEKVMGFRVAGPETAKLRFVQIGDIVHPDHVPRFSTTIACAWEVMERLMLRSPTQDIHLEHHRDSGWGVSCCDAGSGFENWTYAPTAPHAICLAALKAVDV